MSWRSPVRGYAHIWSRVSVGIAGNGSPVRSITRPGAIAIGGSVPVLYGHDFARPRASAVDVWADDFGVAFEFVPLAGPLGYSLVSGIAQGRYSDCSCGLADEVFAVLADGVTIAISSARLTEISILPRGGNPGAAAWSTAYPLHQISPEARALEPRWAHGQVKRKTWNCRREVANVGG